jgi:molecular chaperone GrpE
MTGIHESGHQEVERGSEVDETSEPRHAHGAEGAELGTDYGEPAPSPGDVPDGGGQPDPEIIDPEIVDPEIVDAEIVDAEIVDDDLDDDRVTTEIIDGTAPELDAVTRAEAQRDEFLDSLRRLQAEFENYKKRVVKQQSDQVARAAVSLVEKVLPVLDTLDLATQHLGDAESADGRALAAVASQLHDVLAKEGLERIDPIGEEFDPNAHEAVGHLPVDDGEGAEPVAADAGGTGEPVVGQVMRPGYRWRGAVVRPAMVMVRA